MSTGNKNKNAVVKPQPQPVAMIETTVAQSYHFQGPIPHPALLKGYEDAHPGAAKIILDMAVADQRHSQEMDRKNNFNQRLGMILVWSVLVICCVMAFFLAWNDKKSEALGSVLTGLAPLVVTHFFVWLQGRSSGNEKTGKEK